MFHEFVQHLSSWSSLDTAIAVSGALAAMSCALPGVWLVLRRHSMMGDALAHSALPGVVLAYIFAYSLKNAGLVPEGSFELLISAGLRIGEALGLAVCDLDREHSLIRVEYQLGRDGDRTPLKTEESRRAIDIPPRLMRRLLALVAERGAAFDPAALVFASRNGSGLERKVAREALKRAVKAAGIAAPEPSLHDLRHSHASMLIALDVPLVDVQRRLGHRKPDTTLRVYAHQWKEREARRSQIGRQLGQLFAERKQLPARRRRGSRFPRRAAATTTERRSSDRSGTDRGA